MPLPRSPRLPFPLIVLLLGSGAAQAQQPFDVALRDGLLSIRANGASVTELAAALAAETGISFVVTGDGGTPITAEIVDEPFVKAVAKLSPNHLLVRDGESVDAPVTEVVLMLDDAAGGGGGGDGFLPSGAPADEIIGGDVGAGTEVPPDGASIDDTMRELGEDVPGANGAVQEGLDPNFQGGEPPPAQ